MHPTRLRELHFITPITNVPSIVQHGILSHNRIDQLGIPHDSVADPEIQALRANKRVPAGLPLHDYANVYLNGRNSMLYRLLKRTAQQLCLVRLDRSIVNAPGAVISDCNAACGVARFLAPAQGIQLIDASDLFAQFWTKDASGVEYGAIKTSRHKQLMQAELLVPYVIPPRFVTGIHVAHAPSTQLRANNPSLDTALRILPIEITPQLFFRW